MPLYSVCWVRRWPVRSLATASCSLRRLAAVAVAVAAVEVLLVGNSSCVSICRCFLLVIKSYRLINVLQGIGFVRYRNVVMSIDVYRFRLWTVRRPFLAAILGQFVVRWRLCWFPEQF